MKTYPLHRYEIDQHIDAGLTNLAGTVDAIPHALAAMLWAIDRHLAEWVILLFDAAFNVDLINGSSGMSVGAQHTTRQLYDQLAQPLMTTALLATGIWAIWQLLLLRRFADGGARLLLSLAYCVLCTAIVLAPTATIGTLSTTARQLSTATLSAVLPGSGTNATQTATDGLRATLIHEPWILLQFGATAHCLDSDDQPVRPTSVRSDGTPIPPRGAKCVDTHKLAPLFLEHEPGSDERNEAFTALNDGDALAKRSVQIQTGAAGYDRVALALGLFAASCGAFILIGGLALGLLAAQLYALLLMCCAPVAVLASLVPSGGHHLVRVWLTQLASALCRCVVYCLYLALAATLSINLARIAPSIGSVGALTLQTALWWGLLIYGRALSRKLGERAAHTTAVRTTTHATRQITKAAINAYLGTRTGASA